MDDFSLRIFENFLCLSYFIFPAFFGSIIWSLISIAPMLKKNTLFKHFFHEFTFCLSIGISAIVIGYMATFSRQTAIPEILPILISVFVGALISQYSHKNKETGHLSIPLGSLSLMYFIIFLWFGALIGSLKRDQYERLDAPIKQAEHESTLKQARKEYGLSNEKK